MSLSGAQKTIPVPDRVERGTVVDIVKQVLREKVDLESLSMVETGNTIEAKSHASLRSWGQDIRVEINPYKVTVEIESPDQVVDFGKSKSTVDSLAKEIRSRLERARRNNQ